MSDIKLFRMTGSRVMELKGESADLEKPLQSLIETNLETLLGVRFVASEYPTGRSHAGRIDTLGLDENCCPVILEYKRSIGENVISQGLYYLDWLVNAKAEFKLLIIEKFGKSQADEIDWSAPRLICIAADFTKYDAHAVQQMNRNIELIRYRRFGSELLLFELVNTISAIQHAAKGPKAKSGHKADEKSLAETLAKLNSPLREIFGSLDGYLLSLGDDVERKELKLYLAYKRLKNFACVQFYREKIHVYTHLNPTKVNLVKGFSRDVSNVGHFGTGNLEIVLRTMSDFERAKPLLAKAYSGL